MSQNVKKIALGADHAGFEMKEFLKEELEKRGYEVDDHGCYSSESVDYPDFGHAVAKDVEKDQGKLGLLLCGSGNGINMAANKHEGIRSALCWNREIAELARSHNDANVLALPSRYITQAEAIDILEGFLQTEFEGGRHERRVDKIEA